MQDCFFCEEYTKGENNCTETGLWRARWDGAPATPGHILIIPKRHAQYFEQLTAAEMAELLPFIQHALGKLNVRGGAPGAFNYGVNDGPVAGQSVPHFHFHIMPRWQSDVPNPRGGVRNLFRDDTYGEL